MTPAAADATLAARELRRAAGQAALAALLLSFTTTPGGHAACAPDSGRRPTHFEGGRVPGQAHVVLVPVRGGAAVAGLPQPWGAAQGR